MPTSDSDGAAGLRDRKRSHLDICERGDVEYHGKTTLFEEVELLHDSLPGLCMDDLDIRTKFLGKTLHAPFVITGMTGGTEEAFAVNRDLALIAERYGIAFGLGSQRVMQRDPSTAWTFSLRSFAPTTPLLANIGVTQAADQPTDDLQDLVGRVDADALCVHLNPAQELIQPEGDRDFRAGLETIERLCAELSVPVIVKETGCGISRRVGDALRQAGVRHVDVSGAGGTSWVRVESLRGSGGKQRLGKEFAAWGIPTAASLMMLRGSGLELIASGGVRNGLEIAKSIALGARLCGAALPVYRAYRAGGTAGAARFIDQLTDGLRTAMLLTGSRTLVDLERQPVVLGERLKEWVAAATRADGGARWPQGPPMVAVGGVYES